MDKKSILVFGVGELQKSIIKRAQAKGLYVVGIDPCTDAACKDEVDAFEVVGGQDYEGTLAIAEKYGINAIITTATDKPLVMMAKVAEKLQLPFYSVDTAVWSTDKLLMKERFQQFDIPCAKGFIIESYDDLVQHSFSYPVIVKPRDNSGSRGVIYCKDEVAAKEAINEALQYTKKGSILVEEFIEGKEYSIESLHFNNESHVIQFTEKITTDFPYNVELGHIQPANISDDIKEKIKDIIKNIAHSLNFNNCASHTELKINDRGVFIIETSPRLGGDFITSHLVPLSTYINIEDLLVDISLGNIITINKVSDKSSAVIFFNLTPGVVIKDREKIIEYLDSLDCVEYHFKLNNGEVVPQITNSLNRYGEVIYQNNSKFKIENTTENLKKMI